MAETPVFLMELFRKALTRGTLFLGFFFLGLTACTLNVDVEPLRAPTLTGSLQPYQSPIPSVTPLLPTPAPTETPLPTPTPHLYQITSGDTMGRIALEFGITTNDLIAANPDVPPSSMSVGQELLIPDGEVIPVPLSTLEPLALKVSQTFCYPTLSGGIWCFLSVLNESNEVVESVSAGINLYDANGQLLVQQTAFPLLDRLSVGERSTLLTYFADIDVDITAHAMLLTALPVLAGDSRYFSASVQNVLTEISWDGNLTEISGEIAMEENVSRLWVVATAYDDDGNIVGARRWESLSGERNFQLTVASLGHAIERVELYIEAKR